jgi:hypothetical protein
MHLTRRQVRYIGALASSAMAAIYVLIGLGIPDIGSSTSGETVDLALFGFSACMAYAVLALLLGPPISLAVDPRGAPHALGVRDLCLDVR